MAICMHTSPTTPLHYRPDIDGLRAVAVLSVVAFHAFPEIMPGGFIGVDIFFVISGYLISSIILNDVTAQKFSFGAFYARRIRRLFPALLVVLVSCCLFGAVVMLPMEWSYLQWQVVAGAGFFSNFVFWKTLGYFAPSIDTLPLMHLWSLSIEEQFYLVWPVCMVVACRWRRSLPWVLGLVGLSSFAANVSAVHDNTTAAFYLPYCRFWEMAAGGWLASVLSQRALPEGARGLCAVSGILLLCLAWLLIDKTRFFPGWWAMLPVAATCLLLAAGQGSAFNRHVLSARVLVGLGLISYPLYLWHWPLLSFARILEETTPSVTVRASAVVLSIVLAWLTYRFIELPVRHSPRRRGLIVSLVAAMLLLMLLAASSLWLSKKAQEARDTAAANLEFEPDWIGWEKCTTTWDCRIMDRSKPPQVMVVGDSHAGHLGSGLREVYASLQQNVQVRQRSMCLPVFRLEMDGKRFFDCSVDFIDKALEAAMQSPSVHTVILSGYANQFIYTYPDGVPGNPNLQKPDQTEDISPNVEHVAALHKGVQQTLRRLVASGKRIVFLVDNPELDFEPRECVTLRAVTLPGRQLRDPCAVSRAVYEARSADYHRIVRDMEKTFPSVQFIWLDSVLCDTEQCMAMHGNELFYGDRSHLTPAGSVYVLRAIRDRLIAPTTH
jgi:peptidoglycan/LPS O-acetylase OafA/YrhL